MDQMKEEAGKFLFSIFASTSGMHEAARGRKKLE